MNDIICLPVVAVYYLSYLPVWAWVSLVITLIHTVEEADGEIWDYLSDRLGLPVRWWMYFGFQSFVFWLGFAVYSGGDWWLLFALIRFGDAVGTHLVLQAPGRITAALLLVDCAVVSWMFV